MCGRVLCDCTFKGKNLWGKVQFVDATGFPDFKVQMLQSLADLKVQEVGATGFPNSCGKWQMVSATGFPDFKVQITTGVADFSIQDEMYFPGLGFPPN
jgi:hypothetical protein